MQILTRNLLKFRFRIIHQIANSIRQGHNFANIKVANNDWVDANSVILGGVKIGEGSIIAAGSVVNKNVEPFTKVGVEYQLKQ
tara:strand:+ start:1256 stop:1504 length:249 start_codon:yes stop_codon:yes gene_type:complete